jgi:hypothetical protein
LRESQRHSLRANVGSKTADSLKKTENRRYGLAALPGTATGGVAGGNKQQRRRPRSGRKMRGQRSPLQRQTRRYGERRSQGLSCGNATGG